MGSGSGGEYLGQAVLQLSTDSSKYDAGVKTAKQKAEGLASGFKKTGAALSGVGVVFVALAKGAIDSADEFAKMSQKVGVSVETLSGLVFMRRVWPAPTWAPSKEGWGCSLAISMTTATRDRRGERQLQVSRDLCC